MKQKKINDILYIFQTTPYVITEDTDAKIIKVQEESYPGFVELNPTLEDKLVKYNYKVICVNKQEWMPYINADDLVSPELAWSANSATVTIGADDNVFPTLTNPHDVAIIYSSSDTTKATIDASTGAITLTSAGDTTISAAFAGNDTYLAQTVTYTLTVEEAQVQTSFFVVSTVNGSNPLASNIYDQTEHEWTYNLSYYTTTDMGDHYDVMLAIGHNYSIYHATIASMTASGVTIGSQVDDHYDFTMPNDVVECTVQAAQQEGHTLYFTGDCDSTYLRAVRFNITEDQGIESSYANVSPNTPISIETMDPTYPAGSPNWTITRSDGGTVNYDPSISSYIYFLDMPDSDLTINFAWTEPQENNEQPE